MGGAQEGARVSIKAPTPPSHVLSSSRSPREPRSQVVLVPPPHS